jgi:hypothetical protein
VSIRRTVLPGEPSCILGHRKPQLLADFSEDIDDVVHLLDIEFLQAEHGGIAAVHANEQRHLDLIRPDREISP